MRQCEACGSYIITREDIEGLRKSDYGHPDPVGEPGVPGVAGGDGIWNVQFVVDTFRTIDINIVLIVGPEIAWRPRMEDNHTLKLSDDMIYGSRPDTHSIWIPKKIATIKLCGSLEFFIYENTPNWVQPTPKQIENLKKLFCIEVILED